MGSGIVETQRILEEARQRSSAVLVSYSGGKDAKATLDLCSRSFERVEAFYMFTVPGLECIDEMLGEAEQRYGIKIRRYPHWLVSRWLKYGVYCDAPLKNQALPEWGLRDVYNLATADTKIRLIATGAKKSDSRWRRWNLNKTSGYDDVIYPLLGWSKLDVLSYLRAKKIPLPSGSADGANLSGIDLSTPAVCFLHDEHPEDFKRLCEVFPYAEAIIWRRKFYGGS